MREVNEAWSGVEFKFVAKRRKKGKEEEGMQEVNAKLEKEREKKRRETRQNKNNKHKGKIGRRNNSNAGNGAK